MEITKDETTVINSDHSYLYYDPNSISNFNRFRVNHTHFDLNVDFDRHILHGHVQFDIVRLDQKQCEYSSTIKNTENNEIPHNLDGKLVLDAHQLNVEKVMYETTLLPFEINPEHNSLTIDMEQIPKEAISISILIYYSTSPDQSKALQWMTKEQTADRQYPFMYSQCQAIHARSMYPCQDTPGVKSTYTAKIICPKPLTVLMSAIQTKHDVDTNTFYFEQTVAVPSYLMAIAVGHLVSYDISDRIRVWSEPSRRERCKYEFEETERALSAAEQLLGKYQWKRYDILVLPPSFPYTGMENPCMNFISPATLVGDRSLTWVIVHELTHSWTGNLVTNENWEHFWLNEGFTTFIEAKLLEILAKDNGEARRFHSAQGWEELESTIIEFGSTNPYTCLVYRLKNVDPDDAYNSTQYHKGAALLWFLEHDIVCSEVEFDQFLRSYIQKFSHRVLNTDDFIQYFESYFPQANKVDWNLWLNTPGMPPITIDFSTELERQCRQLANQPELISDAQMKLLNSNQIVYLFNLLLNQKPSTITYDIIKQIDKNCQMNQYSNGDICYRWYQLCIRMKYIEVLEDIFKFLGENGEMKFLKPLYTEFKLSWPEMMPKVHEFFEEHKKYIHPLLVQQIEQRIGK
ncbi:unnamed protein product [Adineta steineri]|uniref:Peptidase M1 leukotriene A4 hydrolase/aminopeptidase C-terminal domain-containing protein n=1 Tax=Adineta steineri TaxID=433720 RepID=A0A815DYH7_9BILA|nr:unnamed protein product [Adineta steineri]